MILKCSVLISLFGLGADLMTLTVFYICVIQTAIDLHKFYPCKYIFGMQTRCLKASPIGLGAYSYLIRRYEKNLTIWTVRYIFPIT